MPGFAFWSEKDRRYILRFDPEIPMTGDIAQDTQRIHAHLESVIRAHPDQWLVDSSPLENPPPGRTISLLASWWDRSPTCQSGEA